MIREYRCKVCHQLLFKGSIALLAKRTKLPADEQGQYIEVMCSERTCKYLNRYYLPTNLVLKSQQSGEQGSLLE